MAAHDSDRHREIVEEAIGQQASSFAAVASGLRAIGVVDAQTGEVPGNLVAEVIRVVGERGWRIVLASPPVPMPDPMPSDAKGAP